MCPSIISQSPFSIIRISRSGDLPLPINKYPVSPIFIGEPPLFSKGELCPQLPFWERGIKPEIRRSQKQEARSKKSEVPGHWTLDAVSHLPSSRYPDIPPSHYPLTVLVASHLIIHTRLPSLAPADIPSLLFFYSIRETLWFYSQGDTVP